MSNLVEALRRYKEPVPHEAADRIEALEAMLVTQQEGSGKLLTDIVAAANKDSKIAADRNEALKEALREIANSHIDREDMQSIASAALAPEQAGGSAGLSDRPKGR